MSITKAALDILTKGSMVLAVWAIGSTNMFGAAVPTGDGGRVSLVNAAPLVGVTANPFCVNWGGGSACVPGTFHPMNVTSFSATFATGASPLNQIQDFSTIPPPPLVNFQTIAGGFAVGGATVHFDLTQVPLNNSPNPIGTCQSNAPFSQCTPAFSPFTFSMDGSGTQVTIQFSVRMNAYTGSSATGVTPYVGIFTTHQSGVVDGIGACANVPANITSILNCEAAGGTIHATWSANESPVTRLFDGCTVTQGGWGAPAHGNNPGTFLNGFFAPNYPAGVQIGSPVFTLLFTSPTAVRNFLPQGGPPSFLTASAIDPTARTSAGVFAGQVLAFELNVDLHGLGTLTLFNTGTPFDGMNLQQILAAVNLALGSGTLPSGFASFSALNDLVDNFNNSFDGCVADSWAAAHLH